MPPRLAFRYNTGREDNNDHPAKFVASQAEAQSFKEYEDEVKPVAGVKRHEAFCVNAQPDWLW
jgi:hypothetical protein